MSENAPKPSLIPHVAGADLAASSFAAIMRWCYNVPDDHKADETTESAAK
jgi:hypothetical protein